MQMMYEIVSRELKAMNIEDQHPQDYLNFYCLGNVEPGETTGQGSEKTAAVLKVAIKTTIFCEFMF